MRSKPVNDIVFLGPRSGIRTVLRPVEKAADSQLAKEIFGYASIELSTIAARYSMQGWIDVEYKDDLTKYSQELLIALLAMAQDEKSAMSAYDRGVVNTFKAIQEMAAEQLRRLRKRRGYWISVKDRLPANVNVNVIVTNGRHYAIANYIPNGTWDCDPHIPGEVTHWHRLPKLSKSMKRELGEILK